MTGALVHLRGPRATGMLLTAPAAILLLVLFFYPLATLFLTTLHPDNIENYARVVSSGTYIPHSPSKSLISLS
jgi:ABC-type sugar transport system permease subunit